MRKTLWAAKKRIAEECEGFQRIGAGKCAWSRWGGALEKKRIPRAARDDRSCVAAGTGMPEAI